jgi:5,10-methenyltetrahydrofolate synthetase
MGSSSGSAALPIVVERVDRSSSGAGNPGWRCGPACGASRWPAVAEPVEPDCLLVPLVGFDDQGYRLGYGGGYYDRTIAAMPRPSLAIGIGYAFPADADHPAAAV